MKIKLCSICIVVGGSWLLLQAGVLLGLLPLPSVQVLIALLMGASVVGIAYQGKRRWPIIIFGLALAFILVNNITWITFAFELGILGVVAYFRFVLPSEDGKVKALEKKLEKCCNDES